MVKYIMLQPVVIDIETKHSFREVNNDYKKLGVSVVAAYDFATKKMSTYIESEFSELFRLLEHSSLIIGYNIHHFDLVVLNEYYVGNILELPHFDLLDDIKLLLGKRLPLDDLVQATLGKGKSGHGLHAIELYRQGKMEELSAYCKDDVQLTKELLDYGVTNGYVYYPDIPHKKMLSVNWKSKIDVGQNSTHNLTLGF